jgi:hypothetical protein
MNLDFFPSLQIQFGNDPVALAEWFIASLVLVIVVTLIYVLVLNKSPPPEGITLAKTEQQAAIASAAIDPHPVLYEADQDLKSNNLNGAIDASVRTIFLAFRNVLGGQAGTEGMGISDSAYIIQTKGKNANQIAQPVYQLNNLRLQSLQGQPVTLEQASWAVNLARWVVDAIDSGQITL